MNDHEIYDWSAVKLVEAMKKKQLSAVEVMNAFLSRIDKMNPSVNGLVQQFSKEDCLKKAFEADQELSKGHTVGKLHGLPFTVKDNLLIKGLVSCAGCTGLKDKVAQSDSTSVARLKKEGAIAVGVTNVPELLSAYETDNLVYGRTNNPYDLQKTPGGSSGGCAAVVASGCTPLSIGSDAAGSIRWPAHCTGIAAHKPTTGLVPRTGSPMGNARGLIGQFATHGPMARYVEDLILTLPILAGPDGIDSAVPPVHLHDPNKVHIGSLRIAYVSDDGVAHPNKEVESALEGVVQMLKKHVSKIERVEIDSLKNAHRLLWEGFYLGGDRAQGTKNVLSALKVDTPSPLLQDFIRQAEKSDLSVTQYRSLFRDIDAFRHGVMETMDNYDILLSPVAATPAKKHGTTLAECRDMNPCMVHSITGFPVTVVRCGSSSENLPIGLQIAAKPWNDHLTLALAAYIEKMTGGWQPL